MSGRAQSQALAPKINVPRLTAAHPGSTLQCSADGRLPAFYMDYAEVQFILAEAALKSWIPGGEAAAKAYYEAGITASMEKWSEQGAFSETPTSITQSDIDTYLASPLGSWDMAPNKEEAIGNQKYLALFWVGMEAWHEYRRTGFPQLTIGAGTVYNDNVLPTRFGYPCHHDVDQHSQRERCAKPTWEEPMT